jgi:hypothetical protein
VVGVRGCPSLQTVVPGESHRDPRPGPELGYRNLVLRDPEGNKFCVGGPSDAAPGS